MATLSGNFARKSSISTLLGCPRFLGLSLTRNQHQAQEHGVKFSGCTAHFVEEGLDSGPIIRQAVVPVEDGDTVESLSARILKEEHRIYSEGDLTWCFPASFRDRGTARNRELAAARTVKMQELWTHGVSMDGVLANELRPPPHQQPPQKAQTEKEAKSQHHHTNTPTKTKQKTRGIRS